jgi:hypothetical protein
MDAMADFFRYTGPKQSCVLRFRRDGDQSHVELTGRYFSLFNEKA